MYHFIEDKEFLKSMRSECSDIINQLVQFINGESTLYVEANLVGSGAKHLETQNNNEPVDLDFNLVILDTNGVDIRDARTIKEYVRKSFNTVLKRNGWKDCHDSTSALSTGQRVFKTGNKTPFSIDLAIICEGSDSWYRLIHEKTGNTNLDRYYWVPGPDSKNLLSRVDWVKDNNLWNDVRDAYLEKKNMYLKRRDTDHPSFICYVEAVNEVYFANK